MRKTAILVLSLGAIVLSGCGERAALTRSAIPNETLPVIVHLQTRDEILTALAGPDGPVYTARTRDGRILAEQLSEQELQAQLPHLHRLLKSSYAAGESHTVIWADNLTPGPQE